MNYIVQVTTDTELLIRPDTPTMAIDTSNVRPIMWNPPTEQEALEWEIYLLAEKTIDEIAWKYREAKGTGDE